VGGAVDVPRVQLLKPRTSAIKMTGNPAWKFGLMKVIATIIHNCEVSRTTYLDTLCFLWQNAMGLDMNNGDKERL
jgi:hypothetical protein